MFLLPEDTRETISFPTPSALQQQTPRDLSTLGQGSLETAGNGSGSNWGTLRGPEGLLEWAAFELRST